MVSGTEARTPLTRERVIDAALALVERDGVDGLSMRRLGQTLGVDPMAVYHHVPNKAALYDGIVEVVWSGVRLPPRTDGESWQHLLHAVFSALRDRLLEHPRAVVLVGTRPIMTPAMLRLVDDSLGRLEAAGLGAKDAMQIIDCLSGYTVGKVLAETGEVLGGQGQAVEATLTAVSPKTHPFLTRAMGSGYAFTPDEEFERGLRALISGWA